MTPTEPSAITTPLTVGRDLDVAVARVMDHTVRWCEGHLDTFYYPPDWYFVEADGAIRTANYLHGGTLPVRVYDYSTDDATALRWGVPWLHEQGYRLHLTLEGPGKINIVPARMPSAMAQKKQRIQPLFNQPTLAAALCQVIVAVSQEASNA